MNELDAQFYQTVGKKIREIRIKKELTLAQLANKLGVTIKTVQRYETGDRKIDVSKLKKIADVLDISYEDFVLQIQKERFPDLVPMIKSEKENEQTKSSRITYKDLPLTEKEEQLLEYFRLLNNKGKDKVLESAKLYTLINILLEKEEIENEQ